MKRIPTLISAFLTTLVIAFIFWCLPSDDSAGIGEYSQNRDKAASADMNGKANPGSTHSTRQWEIAGSPGMNQERPSPYRNDPTAGDRQAQVAALNTDPRTRRPFGKGAPFAIADLPDGILKTQLLALNAEHRAKAMKWLHSFTFNGIDAVESLRASDNGGIFYDCPGLACQGCAHEGHSTQKKASAGASNTTMEEPVSPPAPESAEGAVLISSPPAYNSKPGATNHIYLDFNGGTVAATTDWGGPGWNCYAYSLDTNYDEFSVAEQDAIRTIYQRLAEDYAPFDVNVTTDVAYDPDNYTGDKNYVAWVLITKAQDKEGVNTPAQSGGRAYVGVFGQNNFATLYQPAWVTYDNLSGGNESVVAEAASHEAGHNMGLSHDGITSDSYYGGHDASSGVADSWGPIMGTGYGRNVSQWSKGEYYDAKYWDWNSVTETYDVIANTQDDLAVIASKLSYRSDDHVDVITGATSLVSSSGTISSTTPETDPTNSSPENKGVIETSTDVDVFTFYTGTGNISLTVEPLKIAGMNGSGNNTYGGNLDVDLELQDLSGNVIASSSDSGQLTSSTITAEITSAGNYFLFVKNSGAGSPTSSTPTGYTSYGSVGQYFISGSIIDAASPPRILSSTPVYTSPISPPLTQMQFEFNKPMNPATFSVEADILSFVGPSGVDLSSAITSAVWSNSDSTLTISFSSQSTVGYYRMTLGPNVADVYGNYLDQDLDATQAELIDDDYTAIALIGNEGIAENIWSVFTGTSDSFGSGWGYSYSGAVAHSWTFGTPTSDPVGAYNGTRVWSQNLGGNYNSGENSKLNSPTIDTSGYTDVSLSFYSYKGVGEGDVLYVEVYDGSTWQRVYTLTGPSGGFTDSAWTQQTLDLSGYGDDNAAFKIRWGLVDSTSSPTATGWQVDSVEVNGILGQAPPPPKVVGHSPSNSVAGSRSAMWIEFSQPMDSSGFALSDIESFTGPSGSITPSGFSWVNNSLLQINFPTQSAVGSYSLTLGSQVPDTIGQNLDQDGDGTAGEAADDTYTATFSILSYASWSGSAGAGADANNDGIENGLAWVLGASGVSENSRSLLPVQDNDSDPDYLVFTYRRNAAAHFDPNTTITMEYGSSLTSWNTAVEDGTNVLISEVRNGYAAGVDKVEVKIKKSLATDDKLFTRLKAVITP